jgi:hypothetical protein
MKQKFLPSSAEIIYNALNQRRHQDSSLFSETETSPYWKLSDLAILYPDFFDVKAPVSQQTIKKIKNTVLDSCVPEFYDLTQEPIHVLNTKETFNFYIKDTDEIKTVKNGTNQKISPVACEYLFRQIQGAEFQQAYFLYPDKNADELIIAAQEIRFERIRDQIASSSNILSAIINRANGAKKSSFSEIWSTIWHILYHINNMDELRTQYNIKSSPIDYMKPQTLIYMNSILQDIILRFYNKGNVHINEIKDYAATKAALARAHFIRYGSTPEKQFLEKSSYSRIEKIRQSRVKFWKKYYPLSLQQR